LWTSWTPWIFRREHAERTGFRRLSHCLSNSRKLAVEKGRFREVKNALLLLANTAGGFVKLL